MPEFISMGDVREILASAQLRRIEDRLAAAVGQSVVNPNPELTSELDTRSLLRAELSKDEVLALLTQHEELLVKFGVAILEGESSQPDREEFNPEEGEQDWVPQRRSPIGLGRGVSLKFSCYLSFLLDSNVDGLLGFLKAEGIPYATSFRARLRRYYRSCRAA